MASLAGMLKEKGYIVTGSDQNMYPPMSTQLKNLDIHVNTEYNSKNIKDGYDLVVIGNTAKRENVEVEAALKGGLKYSSFAETFSTLFLKDNKSVVVAGTHGKSTTTSLVSWIFEKGELNPSFFTGGIPTNFGKSYKLGRGEYFVIEGDEYDTAFFDKRPKFLHYKPFHTVITSIEFDHADIYESLAQIIREFENLAEIIHPDGSLTACIDCPNVKNVLEFTDAPVSTYSTLDKSADFFGKIKNVSESGMKFEVFYKNKSLGEFLSKVVGEHNLANILAAISVSSKVGLSMSQIKDGIKTFEGVTRRQEIRGIVKDIIVIDDFAHHPTAVLTTNKAIKDKYKDRRLWCIFEPRTNTTRRNFFERELAEALSVSDEIIIAKVFKPELIEEGKRLNVKNIISKLKKQKKRARYIEEVHDIVTAIKDESKPGDVILIMSNGGFDNIHEKILGALRAKWSGS